MRGLLWEARAEDQALGKGSWCNPTVELQEREAGSEGQERGELAPGSAGSAKGEPPVSPLASPQGATRQDRDKQLQSQGEAAPHHCSVGQGSFPHPQLPAGPQ